MCLVKPVPSVLSHAYTYSSRHKKRSSHLFRCITSLPNWFVEHGNHVHVYCVCSHAHTHTHYQRTRVSNYRYRSWLLVTFKLYTDVGWFCVGFQVITFLQDFNRRAVINDLTVIDGLCISFYSEDML